MTTDTALVLRCVRSDFTSRATLAGGHDSTLTGGNGSVLICRYWRKGWRVAVAVVDGDTIKAGVAYDYSVENGAWQESHAA